MRRLPKCLLLLLSLVLSLTPTNLHSQEEIPIDVLGPRVVVPMRVNGSPPLDLVLDTGMGMRGVYLFRKEYSEWVDHTPNIMVQIPGAGGGESSTARIADAQTLTAGSVVLDSQTVFVGQSDRTQEWSFDGIIGKSLLVDYTVEIDYDFSVMRLHHRSWRPGGPEWTRVPVGIQRGLPWFEAEVETADGVTHPTRVYLDLASASTLELFVGSGRPFTPPSGAEEAGWVEEAGDLRPEAETEKKDIPPTRWQDIADREGVVRKAVTRQSSGNETLDRVALHLATKLRFYPALDGATPVPAWFAVPFQFPSGDPRFQG
ncbi:MAG: energy transducer TonB [Gemmatimonadota bacterium]|jgi:TonB family protein